MIKWYFSVYMTGNRALRGETMGEKSSALLSSEKARNKIICRMEEMAARTLENQRFGGQGHGRLYAGEYVHTFSGTVPSRSSRTAFRVRILSATQNRFWKIWRQSTGRWRPWTEGIIRSVSHRTGLRRTASAVWSLRSSTVWREERDRDRIHQSVAFSCRGNSFFCILYWQFTKETQEMSNFFID